MAFHWRNIENGGVGVPAGIGADGGGSGGGSLLSHLGKLRFFP